MSRKISELSDVADVNQQTAMIPIVQGGVNGRCSPRALQGEGWGVYFDSTYTSGSPLAVNSSRVKLLNDGADSRTNTSYLPHNMLQLWDTVNSKIISENSGDCYDTRVQFTAESDRNAYMDIEFDIGGAIGVIAKKTLIFPKANLTPTTFVEDFPIFTLATFIANGCEIYVNTSAGGANVNIYDFSIFIKRDFAAS